MLTKIAVGKKKVKASLSITCTDKINNNNNNKQGHIILIHVLLTCIEKNDSFFKKKWLWLKKYYFT